MIDSSHKNIEELTFASAMRKSRRVSHRRISGIFATICWFHDLKMGLKVETISAVQRTIEAARDGRDTAIRRRWGDYKNGHNKPEAVIVDLAELQVPGSKAIFQSLLWSALRLDKSAVKIAHELLGTTSKEGDELLQWMLNRRRSSKSHRWIHKRCRALVIQGSLEGLAVITVCMRLASCTGLPYVALVFYLHATDYLKIIGSWFYLHGIAQAVADYYEKTLLPACYGEYQCGMFNSGSYLYSIVMMARAVERVQEKAGRVLTRKERISEMLKLIDR